MRPSRSTSRLDRRHVAVFVVVSVSTLAFASPAATEAERLTVDRIFEEDLPSAVSVPRARWLPDGTVLLSDRRIDEAERTLERFDPDTGGRAALVDRERALASLADLVGEDAVPEAIGWPLDVLPDGSGSLHVIEGVVARLDFATSTFSELAASDDAGGTTRLSPDGRHVAFVRDGELFVVSVDGGAERRLTFDASGTVSNGTVSWVYWEEVFGRRDGGYAWSPDGTRIAFLQSDETFVGTVTFTDFEPATPRSIVQRYPKAGTTNPRVRLGVVDVVEPPPDDDAVSDEAAPVTSETPEVRWVDLGGSAHEYLVRFDWHPGGGALAVQTLDRDQRTLDLWLVDDPAGDVRHVLRETDPAWIDLHDDLTFLEDGRRFLWASDRDGTARLYLRSLDETSATALTAGAPTLVRTSRGDRSDRAVAHVDEDAGHVYFTARGDDPIERHLYRVGLDGKGLERVSREPGQHRVTASPDGTLWLSTHSALNRPPELRIARRDGATARVVTPRATAALEALGLREREVFTVPARDGYPLPASWIVPERSDPDAKLPVVLYVYGGPAAPVVHHRFHSRPRDWFEHVLADEGIATVRVDNRTSTGVDKATTRLALHELWGAPQLADLLDAVEWLKAQPWVDPERIGIWGWSGGGTHTLQAMTSSSAFRAGIAGAPVTDWHFYDTFYTERFMKRPQDAPEAYRATSNVARAGELRGRLLLMTGTYDDNVHPQNAWAFADALVEAGIVFETSVYPMQKHGFRGDAVLEHRLRTFLDFWRRHLLP